MRRSSLLTTLALAASTFVVAHPASAMEPIAARPDSSKAKLVCQTGVVGVDGERHVRYDTVRNNEVVGLSRSRKALGFDVTAWGFYDSGEAANKKEVLRLDAVTSTGVTRRVAITFKGKKNKIVDLGSTKFQKQEFTPRVFADGAGYYVYTVNSNVLYRWTLTRTPQGLAFLDPVGIGKGYSGLTSLTSTTFFEIKGVLKEVLYGTFADGSLVQIQVPVKKPGKARVRYLASSGYAGVTELSMSICNDKGDYHSIIAIDPVANTATWTTVRGATKRARTTFRGAITGGADWRLTAAY